MSTEAASHWLKVTCVFLSLGNINIHEAAVEMQKPRSELQVLATINGAGMHYASSSRMPMKFNYNTPKIMKIVSRLPDMHF